MSICPQEVAFSLKAIALHNSLSFGAPKMMGKFGQNWALWPMKSRGPHLGHPFAGCTWTSSPGWLQAVYPLQEVELDGMLGYAVSELVKELAAVGECKIPLVQLGKKKKTRKKTALFQNTTATLSRIFNLTYFIKNINRHDPRKL